MTIIENSVLYFDLAPIVVGKKWSRQRSTSVIRINNHEQRQEHKKTGQEEAAQDLEGKKGREKGEEREQILFARQMIRSHRGPQNKITYPALLR